VEYCCPERGHTRLGVVDGWKELTIDRFYGLEGLRLAKATDVQVLESGDGFSDSHARQEIIPLNA
jgi:hypothetical protein